VNTILPNTTPVPTTTSAATTTSAPTTTSEANTISSNTTIPVNTILPNITSAATTISTDTIIPDVTTTTPLTTIVAYTEVPTTIPVSTISSTPTIAPIVDSISQETIQSVQSVIQSTVTTAIATSITTAVASSVSASVSGSSSIPGASPAGLITMISTLQVIDMKNNLKIGEELPAAFKGVTESVPWINLEFNMFSSSNSKRRNLQESEIQSSMDILKGSATLFIIILSICTPLFILHYNYHKKRIRQNKKLKGLMCFPNIEILVLSLISNPLIKQSAKLFGTGTSYCIIFGIFLLIIIPIPFVVISSYIIYIEIFKTLHSKFIVPNSVDKIKNPLNFIKRSLVSTNIGYWKDKNGSVEKYGILFKDVRGPIYVYKDTRFNVEWNPYKHKYVSSKIHIINEKFKRWRVFYKPYFILKNMMVIIFLQGFNYISQIFFLVVFYFIHISLLVLIAPFNSHKQQLVEVLTSLCEFGTYICGVILLMISNNQINSITKDTISSAMFSIQLATIGIQIMSQMTIFITLLGVIYNKIFINKQIGKTHNRLLAVKYGYKWLNIYRKRKLNKNKLIIYV